MKTRDGKFLNFYHLPFILIQKQYGGFKGVARDRRGKFPLPETEKIIVEKIVLFPKALFLVTNFQK